VGADAELDADEFGESSAPHLTPPLSAPMGQRGGPSGCPNFCPLGGMMNKPLFSLQSDPSLVPDVPPGATAVLTVDLEAVAGNWCKLRQRVGPACTVAAAVKADAYGLGLAPVALTLAEAGCRWFFVATLDEGSSLATLLQPSFPTCRIAMIAGPVSGTAPDIAGIPALVPVLNDPGQLEAWRRTAPRRPALLQLDTGMSRLGFEPAEARRLGAEPERLEGLHLAGVMSHLACADTPAHPMNLRQRTLFEALTRPLPPMPRSLAASSGIFLGPDFHYDMVRPGAALYGLNPLPSTSNPMTQVVGLKAKILQIREIDAGVSVGYGARHTTDRPCRVATLGLGYADGLLRGAGDRARVFVGTVEAPIIGRVSMDLITVDVSAVLPSALQPGDFVDVIGPQGDADALAQAAGTIGYELLARLGSRIPRVYRHRVHQAASL
jgi:alanine racemase